MTDEDLRSQGPVEAQPPKSGQHVSSGTNGYAAASLATGLVGIFIPIALIVAIVFGVIARRQINRSNGTQRGRGLATAGILLGVLFIAIDVLVVIAVVLASA